MRRKTLSFLLVLFAVCGAFAQQKLNVRDVTPELSVYPCQDRYEALVVIRCSENFELEFKSNVDKSLDVVRQQEGSEKIYNIVFKTREEGTSFKGRMLSVIAPGFDKYYLPLNLKQKEKKEFLVTDPYSSLRSIYYLSLDKASEFFTLGMYTHAKDQYRIAQRCPEYSEQENSVNEYIALCDSMVYWTEVVDSAVARDDYYRARDYMALMSRKNPGCTTLRERYFDVQQSYVARCNADMTNGEQYMLDGYYEKAREVYQNAIDMRNPRMGEAESKLHEIEKLTFKKTHRTRTVFYQFVENCPIGIFAAGCIPSSSAGYFSMNFNRQCFDLLTNVNEQYYAPKMDYEVGVSAGWTIPVFKSYVFAFFTPLGYAGGGYSKVSNDDGGSDKGFMSQDIHWYHAVTPEAGVIVKYWRLAFNYKYQYRYWIGDCDGIKPLLGHARHSFGVGFAW